MQDGAPYENAFFRYAPGRKLRTTTDCYMGWVPSAARFRAKFNWNDGHRKGYLLQISAQQYVLLFLVQLLYVKFLLLSTWNSIMQKHQDYIC
jgi:hypothetical protein